MPATWPPLLHSGRLKPEVRAKRALLDALALELGTDKASHRDLVVDSWVFTGGLTALRSEQGHTGDLSGFVEGMLEATMCIAEFGDTGHHNRWHCSKATRFSSTADGPNDCDEARARKCRAAAFLANMGVSTARKLSCFNLIAKDVATYVADIQQKSLPFTMAAITNEDCLRQNVALACSHLEKDWLPCSPAAEVHFSFALDATYIRKSSAVIPTGLVGKSPLGVGFVGGKWSPDPSKDFSFVPLATGRKEIQDAQGRAQEEMPRYMQRKNLATQVYDFLIHRADCDSPPFSIDSVPRGPEGDGLDFARLMGTHLNQCLEQQKFVQCQATDNGTVFC